jgi:hypothetical protein
MVAGRPIPVTVGDTEVLVETLVVAGTEPTAGRAQQAVESAAEALGHVQQVIVEMAKSTAAPL